MPCHRRNEKEQKGKRSMYPFTSRGDHHHGINQGSLAESSSTQNNTNQNPNMNSLGFRASSSSSLSLPTFPPLNYSSSSSLRDCTSIDPLTVRAACSSQSYRSSCNPWTRDHGENSNIPVNGNGLSPEREVHHLSNNSMLNCGSNSLSMGTVRMKKKVRRKVREPRFCFKTLSDVDVLDDGYKWRKYGQKVVKNTQHPRSYYRCTQDNCRVKKRIERLAEDPRMVITTYEGRHAHSPSHDDEEPQASSQMNFLW